MGGKSLTRPGLTIYNRVSGQWLWTACLRGRGGRVPRACSWLDQPQATGCSGRRWKSATAPQL